MRSPSPRSFLRTQRCPLEDQSVAESLRSPVRKFGLEWVCGMDLAVPRGPSQPTPEDPVTWSSRFPVSTWSTCPPTVLQFPACGRSRTLPVPGVDPAPCWAAPLGKQRNEHSQGLSLDRWPLWAGCHTGRPVGGLYHTPPTIVSLRLVLAQLQIRTPCESLAPAPLFRAPSCSESPSLSLRLLLPLLIFEMQPFSNT